jgi:hypothetical protein
MFCFLAFMLVQFVLVLGLLLLAFLQAIDTSGGSSFVTSKGYMLMPADKSMACVVNQQTTKSVCCIIEYLPCKQEVLFVLSASLALWLLCHKAV